MMNVSARPAIARARLTVPSGTEALHHRLRAERAMDPVDCEAVRPGEILLVRRLSGVLGRGSAGARRLGRDLEAGVAAARAAAVTVAVPGDAISGADALLFPSLDVLLLTLSLDMATGEHRGRWYWRDIGVLLHPVPESPGHIAVQWPAMVPSVVALARRAGVLHSFAAALSEQDAVSALAAMADVFAAPRLRELPALVGRLGGAEPSQGSAVPPPGAGTVAQAFPADTDAGRAPGTEAASLGPGQGPAPGRAPRPGSRAAEEDWGGGRRARGPGGWMAPGAGAWATRIRVTEAGHAGPMVRALLGAALSLEARPGAVEAAVSAGLAAAGRLRGRPGPPDPVGSLRTAAPPNRAPDSPSPSTVESSAHLRDPSDAQAAAGNAPVPAARSGTDGSQGPEDGPATSPSPRGRQPPTAETRPAASAPPTEASGARSDPFREPAHGPSVGTALGGVFYLLNILARAGLLESDEAQARRGEHGGWAVFREIARRAVMRILPMHPSALEDGIWGMLDHLAGDADAAALGDDAWTRDVERALAHEVRRCTWPRRSLRSCLEVVFLRHASITTDGTHLDVRLRLDEVDLHVRAAGLDVDPGWQPWLGRIVLFHYE